MLLSSQDTHWQEARSEMELEFEPSIPTGDNGMASSILITTPNAHCFIYNISACILKSEGLSRAWVVQW